MDAQKGVVRVKHELTRDELIHAMENCVNDGGACAICPFNEYAVCKDFMIKAALAELKKGRESE